LLPKPLATWTFGPPEQATPLTVTDKRLLFGEGTIVGIGGGARANLYKVDTFAVGASTLHDVRVLTGLDARVNLERHRDGFIVAYQPVPACMSESMSDNDVLVGLDFLKHFNYASTTPTAKSS
jgi:hypothetical protein